MTTVSVGNRAEQAAADFLLIEGYEVLEQNFRRKHCEIDIVAQKDGCIFFVEVKYRGSDANGSGFAYIGTRKLQHMGRAAATWVAAHRWDGEYTLSAIEVSGADYVIDGFIESI